MQQMGPKFRPRLETALIAATLVVFSCLILIPYAKNGLWFDDSLNSETWGMVNRFHTTVWQFALQVSKSWASHGRILLCWPWIYEFFYVVTSPRWVRLLDVLLLAMNIGAVAFLLRMVRVNRTTVALFVVSLLALFQIRDNDDPIAAYATFSQFLGIAMAVALILLVKWRKTGRSFLLWLSVAVASTSLVWYEINMIYFVIMAAMIALSKHSMRTIKILVGLSPLLLFVTVGIVIKHLSTSLYPGAAFGSIKAIPVTYAKQFFGAFPASFYLLRGRAFFPVRDLATSFLHSPVALLVAILSALLLRSLLLRVKRDVASARWEQVMIAGAFVAIPPALISLSSRYQSSLSWGDPHIPVYYQYFGLAFISAAGAERFWAARPSRSTWPFVLGFSICVSMLWLVNMRQCAYLDSIFSEPRRSFEQSLRAGLLDHVMEGDVLEIEGQPNFINGNLIYQTIHKNVSIPHEVAIEGWFTNPPRAGASHFRLLRGASKDAPWQLLKAP